MKLCSYIVRTDAGFAPNPFWGYCTLAVCTPNHQGSRLNVGDWIAGFLSKNRGHKFLYAMEISEILYLDEYYHDVRFREKRPNLHGTCKERCGDNFYSRDSNGQWFQHDNLFHHGEKIKGQDTRHGRVFIGNQFWYLGKSAAETPKKYIPLIGGRGARVTHDPLLVSDFCAWVKQEFKSGITDTPNDNLHEQLVRIEWKSKKHSAA